MFEGHIKDGTLFLTDGLRSYYVLESLADCTVKNVEDETASSKSAEVLEKLETKLFNIGRTSYTHTISDVRSLRLLEI